MSEHISWFADCAAAGADRVGGKALGLGLLTQRDLPVPPGFAVTTDAYRRHVAQTGLIHEIVDVVGSARTVTEQAEASRHIERLFAKAGVCEPVAAQLRAAYARLGEPPVAVRSSADAEDTADASFAGQQESFLWVQGPDDVVRHLARCWASLFTPQAIAYRADRGIAPGAVAMGVVVQRMVPATAAGVMMTLDPVTGDRSQIAIEACVGLGVGVVSGEVDPDRFALDKITFGVRSRHCPGEPCVTDEELRELATLGRRLERELGSPQDIEWAYGEGGPGERELFLLQTRPETVWSKRQRAAAPSGATAMDRLLATLKTPVRLRD
jgi:phosphoenolpyruvate synthase/pyruvate phosphate dikinase